MKRLLLAGLALGLAAGQVSFAQDKDDRFVDGVYFTGTDAKEAAKETAKEQQEQYASEGTQYYNSSDQYYSDGEKAQVYSDGQYGANDDGYIDYDDDSYASRIRRFQYPFSGIGYWGSIYDPFWTTPFYSYPYYGWGSWYRPGISISFGSGPYWTSYWGMNTWYGYGGFGSWYYPYGYYGWGGYGYGAGYWSGYYAGLYDGVGYYNPVRRANYGPRGARNNGHATGNYGRSSRTSPIYRDGMVTPQRKVVQRDNSGRNMRTQPARETNLRLRTASDQQRANSAKIRVQPDQDRNARQQRSSRSIFNWNRSNNTPTRSHATPSRSVRHRQDNSPSRNYTPSRRSYNPPSRSSSPSRSSGSFRSSGGRSVHRR